MAYKYSKYCLYSSILFTFMLLYQVSAAQYDFHKTDNWIQENLEELGGRAILMIYKDGKIIYSRNENDLNSKQKILTNLIARRTGKNEKDALKDFDANTKINIASCSKWLSAALVMTFVDEGKLKLEDSIGKFLPIMTNHGKGKITIADCLSHLTGIQSGKGRESRELMNKAATMDDAIKAIALQPMESEPGTSFHYSSVGLQLAAAAIEKIGGKNFKSLFSERIAKPCSMTNTDFGNNPVPLPAGGALSTASDYLNFLQMILENGMFNGIKVLSKQSVELMQQNYIPGKKIVYSPTQSGNWGYGFGTWIIAKPTKSSLSKASSSPGLFGSFPWVDNEHKYAAVLFSFNVKSKGRHEKYQLLKKLVDDAISNN